MRALQSSSEESSDGVQFAVADVIGRDEAPPKPDPGGLLHLARQWQVPTQALVMVGDYLFDLECARAAGAHGVLVNLPENPWPALSSGYAEDCAELLRQLS
ncbi:MAG: HAD family hydrolase [Pseudomonas sp.]|nr:HAD family hydrolase [Pseudomonas sp.]